jgi:hypothetical protein
VELTGLPFKGIIRNFKEPKIVFNILFDYFNIKGNLYTLNGTISQAVFNIFAPYRLSKKYSVLNNLNKR